ncbi:hypothetical protein ACFSBG_15700 [Georgenia yuyongxinii]|nr:hypothetical protein [Georgenia yuyongxinii]
MAALGATSILLLAACTNAGGAPGGSDADSGDLEAIKLRVPTLYGPDHFQTKAMAAYADAVKEASDGSITMEFFYGDSLVKPADTINALRDGVVDIALSVPVYSPSDFPIDQWTTRLAFLQTTDPVVSSLQATSAILDWSINDPDQMAEYDKLGIVPLIPRFYGHESYHLLCKTPVTDLASAQGQRARVGGQVWQDEIESFGMVGVSLAGAEIYEGFQRGVIDCYAGSAPDMVGSSLDEVGKHYTTVGMSGVSSLGLMMSQTTWDRLPLEAKQILWDESPVFLTTWHAGYIDIKHDWFVEDRGLTFHEADDDLLDALDSHQQRQLAEAIDTAPATVSDPADAIERFEAAYDTWLPVIKDDLGYDTGYTTWVEWAQSTDGDVDLAAWADHLTEDILAPHRPK